MIGKTPLRALSLIDELDLHSVIFPCEVNPSRQDALATAHILHRVLGDASGDELLWFAAYVSPFRDHIIKRKKEEPAISVILGEGLKVCFLVRSRLIVSSPLASRTLLLICLPPPSF